MLEVQIDLARTSLATIFSLSLSNSENSSERYLLQLDILTSSLLSSTLDSLTNFGLIDPPLEGFKLLYVIWIDFTNSKNSLQSISPFLLVSQTMRSPLNSLFPIWNSSATLGLYPKQSLSLFLLTNESRSFRDSKTVVRMKSSSTRLIFCFFRMAPSLEDTETPFSLSIIDSQSSLCSFYACFRVFFCYWRQSQAFFSYSEIIFFLVSYCQVGMEVLLRAGRMED